jgi:predicted RNase H-like HicB family nuclease
MIKNKPLQPPSKTQVEAARSYECFCYNESNERQNEMKFTVEYEQEEDGRWLAEVKELPGVLAYGKDPDDAASHAQALALRVIADRLENGESAPSLMFTFEMA